MMFYTKDEPSDVLVDIAFMELRIKDEKVFLDIKNKIIYLHDTLITPYSEKTMNYTELILSTEREYVRLVDEGFLDGGSDA